MSYLDKTEVIWPPRGWHQLETIYKLSGQVIVKNPVFGTISGVSYIIEPTPVLSAKNKNKFLYHVKIEGWEYDINNTSREFPILSFDVKERICNFKNRFLFYNIKSSGRPLRTSQILSQRVLSAALHFIHEIDNGNAPDQNNILTNYKIHPSQVGMLDTHNEKRDFTRLISTLFNNADNNNAAQ